MGCYPPGGQQVLGALAGLDGLRGRREVRREEIDEGVEDHSAEK
ncbi:hypothetical protein [Arthrobacter sp. UYEF3]